MKRELLRQALGMIDDRYIEESLCGGDADARPTSERNLKMNSNKFPAKRTKMIIAIAAAVALVLTLTVSAAAARGWSLAGLFERSGRELPEEAQEYIEVQADTAQEAEWSCSVLESLCDGRTVTAAVEVRCTDDFVLIPTDSSAGDAAGSLGIDYDGTLGEYAAAQGKALMNVGAAIRFGEAPDRKTQGYLHFERLSDSALVVLVHCDEAPEDPEAGCLCIVYAGDRQTELEFTVVAAPAEDSAVYVPQRMDAVPGILFGEAIVTETVTGITLECRETVLDKEAFSCMEMRCADIGKFEGGSVNKDGEWYLELTGSADRLPDTITLQVFDCATAELLGEVVFVCQQA